MACLRAPVCQQHLTLRQELLPKVSSTGIYISGASLRPLRDRVKGSTMSGAALQLTLFHFLHTRKLLSPAKARAALGILLLASLPASLRAPQVRASLRERVR